MTNGPASVLLIDDHADSRDMYATMLRTHGFVVTEAVDGAHAVAVASALTPSIVVSDLRMPGPVSAVAVCQHFAAVNVPVIVLTAVSDGREQDEVRDAGCALLAMKPLAPDALIAEIRRILGVVEHSSQAE